MSGPIVFETYRGAVYPHESDINQHMNIANYLARFDISNWHILARIGLTPERIRAEKITCVAMKVTIEYRKEVLAGDLLFNSSMVVGMRNPEIYLRTQMFNATSGELVAQFDEQACCFDLETRRPVPFPEDVVLAAQRLIRGEAGDLPAKQDAA